MPAQRRSSRAGLERRGHRTGRQRLLKLDELQWRIAVHPSGSPDGPEGPGRRIGGLGMGHAVLFAADLDAALKGLTAESLESPNF